MKKLLFIFFIIACGNFLHSLDVDDCFLEVYFAKSAESATDTVMIGQTYSITGAINNISDISVRLLETERDLLTIEDFYIDSERVQVGNKVSEVTVLTNPEVVVFHLGPQTQEKKTIITVRYRMKGVFQKYEAFDRVILKIYPSYGSDIVNTFVAGIAVPESGLFLNKPESSHGSVSLSNSSAIVRAQNIKKDDAVILTINLVKDAFSNQKPLWQSKLEQEKELLIPSLCISIVIILLGCIVAYCMLRVYLKKYDKLNKNIKVDLASIESCEIASVLATFGLNTGADTALSGLLRCARRGEVEIVSANSTNPKGKKSADFEFIVKNMVNDGKTPLVFAHLFNSNKNSQENLSLWLSDSIQKMSEYKIAIENKLKELNYIDLHSKIVNKTLSKLFLLCSLLSAAGIPFLSVLLSKNGLWPLALISASLFLFFAILFSVNLSLVPLTNMGMLQKRKSKAFRNTIDELIHSKTKLSEKDFDTYFEYAAGFGLLVDWLEAGGRSSVSMPSWLGALSKVDAKVALEALESVARAADVESMGSTEDIDELAD